MLFYNQKKHTTNNCALIKYIPFQTWVYPTTNKTTFTNRFNNLLKRSTINNKSFTCHFGPRISNSFTLFIIDNYYNIM